MPGLVLLGAATVAGASYLAPIIISCVVNGVTIIVTFVTTRAFYKRKQPVDKQRQNLEKQQMQRDHATREEASKVAKETGTDVKILLQLSKQELDIFAKNNQQLKKNNEAFDIENQNLTTIAKDIYEKNHSASAINTELHNELEQVKVKLVNVNDNLRLTGEKLTFQEAKFKKTVTKLTKEVENLVNDDLVGETHKLREINQNFHTSLATNVQMQSLLDENLSLRQNIDNKDEIIIKLMNDNNSLCQKLEEITDLLEQNSQNFNSKRAPNSNLNQQRFF